MRRVFPAVRHEFREQLARILAERRLARDLRDALLEAYDREVAATGRARAAAFFGLLLLVSGLTKTNATASSPAAASPPRHDSR